MASLPPLPRGFVLEDDQASGGGWLDNGPPARRDPFDLAREAGFRVTNGYRTQGDQQRLRRAGYNPAPNSAHLRGDAMDLVHPGMSPRQMTEWARQNIPGARPLYHDNHLHVTVDGWGQAPGTPGTRNSGLPPLPAGFELEQRGSLAGVDWDGQPAPAAPAVPQERWLPAPGGPAPQAAQPQPPGGPSAPGRRTIAERPAGTAVAFGMDGAPPPAPPAIAENVMRARGEMEAAFDGGASRAQLLEIARRHQVEVTVPMLNEIDAAIRWRSNNRASLGRVGTFVPTPARPSQGEWRAHQPDAAEQIGMGVQSALEPVMGRYAAAEQARNTADLLDWTGVGDYDAARQYQEAQRRAAAEGRYLDALGNDLGAQVSAAGFIPIVGPALSRLRRAGEAALEGGRRVLGRAGRAEAVEDVSDAIRATGEGAPIPASQGRSVDRIDVRNIPPPPPGFHLEPQIGRVQPLGEQASPVELADVARGIRPGDVTPIPANRIESEAEAIRANPGSVQDVPIPDENAVRGSRTVRTWATGAPLAWRGPVDAETFLRMHGGLRDDGGDLRHMGIIDNSPRAEVPRDRFVGPIRNADGMHLDEARELLAEAGFIARDGYADEVLDVLGSGRNGNRVYRADDMAEAAEIDAARAQRWEAEAAAADGSPIARRVGDPATLDDLDANAPPATAYEDLPRAGGRVGNINLANIESGQDIRRLLQNVEDRFGGFDAARRGTITHAETRALADELGMTADDLLRRRRGQALNAEQALAARQLLARSSDEVLRLAERARGPEASDVTRAAFSEALIRHAAIHEQVTGATAEAGRALSAMRMAARSRAVSNRIHQATVDGMGGAQRLEDIADGILNLQRQGVTPGGLNRFALHAVQPRFRDKLVELWYNSLLSGPQTHVVNMLSNAMTQVLQIPEQMLASAFGQGRRAIRAMRGMEDDFDRVLASEIGPRVVGLMQGAREGAIGFGRTLRTGDVPDFVTKVESRSQRAISGLKGEIVRIPSRLLAAEDEFFKATARRMELSGLAVRQAAREGLAGEARAARIAELSQNPTDEMLERAMDSARYLTFQRPLGPVGSRISAITQDHPWLKLFVPFIRTPTNIFKFAIERSPFAPAMGQWRADFMAGGERRALALSRMALGTGLGMVIAQMAADGTITGGGPESRAEREMLQADGWQPYSIRIGDQYYSYQRLDPLAMTLGTAAGMAESWQSAADGELNEMGAHLISSVVGNLSDKTWLSGLSDVMAAIDDPQRNLRGLTSRLAGSIAVPTGVAQVARWMDPVQREARGTGYVDSALSRIQSRIPGLSDDLFPRRDVLGQEVRSEGGLGPDIASPIWTRTARNDPLLGELRRLGVNIGRPARRAAGGQYNSFDYDRLQETAGRYAREDLQAAIVGSIWRRMDDDQRRDEARRIIRRARADARRDLYTPVGAPRGAGANAPGVRARDEGLPPLPPGFQLEGAR